MARFFNSRIGAQSPDDVGDTPASDDLLSFPEIRSIAEQFFKSTNQTVSVQEYLDRINDEFDNDSQRYPIKIKHESHNKKTSFNKFKIVSKKVKDQLDSILCSECDGESSMNTPGNKTYQEHCADCSDPITCSAIGNDSKEEHCHGCSGKNCDGRPRLFYLDDENAECSTCHNSGKVCPACENNLVRGRVCDYCGNPGQRKPDDPRAIPFSKTQAEIKEDMPLGDEPTEEQLDKYLRESQEKSESLPGSEENEERTSIPFSTIKFDNPSEEKETPDTAKEKEKEEIIINDTKPGINVEPLEKHGPWCKKCNGTGIIKDSKEIGKINISKTFQEGLRSIESLPISTEEKDNRKYKFIFDQYRCKG